MKTLAILVLVALISGCSVNVIVAPDATVIVDDNSQTVRAK